MAQFPGITHVAVTVSDLGRSRPWYQNLFDADPPFVNRSTGQAYDATNADPLGRFLALQVVANW